MISFSSSVIWLLLAVLSFTLGYASVVRDKHTADLLVSVVISTVISTLIVLSVHGF